MVKKHNSMLRKEHIISFHSVTFVNLDFARIIEIVQIHARDFTDYERQHVGLMYLFELLDLGYILIQKISKVSSKVLYFDNCNYDRYSLCKVLMQKMPGN